MRLSMKLFSITSGLVVAMASVFPAVASAATTCASQGPIVSGLWAGVNLATGGRGCGTTAATTSGSANYAALGDSVAAGLGLSAAEGDPACGVSTQAYPALVALALHRGYTNFACSGATVGDLFTEQHLSGTSRDIEPQLSRAFASGTPGLITITAGANDTYWPYFIRKCYVSTCGTSADRTVAAGLLSALRVKLNYALSDIRYLSHNRPPIVVMTGYYQPFSPTCTSRQTSVSASELNWLNAQTAAINQTLMSTTSSYSFVRFAPVSFSGHELCSAGPWIQGLTDAAPFHPTAQGQKAITGAILEQL